MIINAFTLLSLVQLIKHFELDVVQKRKLTPLLWGNIYIPYKNQCNSTNNTCCPNDFNSIPSNQPPTMLCAVLFIGTGLKSLSIQTLKIQERTECSWGHNVVCSHVHCNRPNEPQYANTENTRISRVFIAKQCL